ncbi:MAG: hypothetical protein ACKPHU_12415, partial [Planctomycetaceae bacterium]
LGASLLLLNVVRHMPPQVLLLTIGLSVAVSPVLQQIVDYSAWWSAGYFETEQTLSELTIGFLVTGYFPVFPWIALPFTGFLSAPAILGLPSATQLQRRFWILSCAGLAALVVVLLAVRWTTAWGQVWLPACTAPRRETWSMRAARLVPTLSRSGLPATQPPVPQGRRRTRSRNVAAAVWQTAVPEWQEPTGTR